MKDRISLLYTPSSSSSSSSLRSSLWKKKGLCFVFSFLFFFSKPFCSSELETCLLLLVPCRLLPSPISLLLPALTVTKKTKTFFVGFPRREPGRVYPSSRRLSLLLFRFHKLLMVSPSPTCLTLLFFSAPLM